jgi:hypothetical protein
MAASMQVELVPGVSVRVFAHELRTQAQVVPCWSYVTEGLRAHRQREIVFTLVRPHGAGMEQAPRDPLQLLGAIAQLAAQGRVVDEGGVTEVGPTGMFGQPALRGVVYQAASPMEGVALPPGALAAVAVVHPEMETAKRFGALRVLARLGRAHRFYPTAVWCEPGRAPLMGPESGSILEGVASAHIVGLTIAMAGDQVVLRVARSAQPGLRDGLATLPAQAALALMASLDPAADGCLVWNPGQSGPEAISPPGSRGARLSGCFALFIPEQAGDGANPFEDGFAVTLTDTSWARIRAALSAGQPLTVAGNRALVLEWVDAAPVAAPPAPAVSEMRMTLRESQADIEARIGMNALVQYAESVEKTVHQHFTGPRGPGALVYVDVYFAAGYRPGIRVTCWPEVPAAGGLQQRLESLPFPAITSGEVAFRGELTLWGGPPSA